MTPGALLLRLQARDPRPWPTDPVALLHAVEAAAMAAPGDPGWTALLVHTHRLVAAEAPLPPGLRREAVVRFDAFSVTVLATDPDGANFLVRAPRPDAPPVLRRALERDRAALAELVEGIHLREGALVAPAPGAPLAEVLPAPGEVPRLLGAALHALSRWTEAGLAPPDPAPAELRLDGAQPRFVALTPGPADPGPALQAVAAGLIAEGALGRLIAGLRELPPGGLAALTELFTRALAEDLGTRAVELRRRGLLAGHGRRREGLKSALRRLEAALPPPEGRGAVGYDLDGQPTAVWCADRILRWGPSGAEGEVVWDAEGFRPPVARRLLRACAAAPIGSDLLRQTGGSAAYTDLIGRWVATGLKLRTARLLLERA